MPIEGEITVSLHWDGQRVRHASLVSTRPLAAARVLPGRRPADAAALVPRLFAICGQAQAAASAAALRAATADADDKADRAGLVPADARAVVLETVQETLWRLLIDAPRSLSLPPQAAAVAPARAAVARATAALNADPAQAPAALAAVAATLGAIAREQVYGCDAAAWLQGHDAAAFDAWRDNTATLPARALARLAATAPGLCRSDTALMPALDDASWWSAVVPALQRDPLFAQSPTWGGQPVETGALSRLQSQPLVAALIARDGHSAATRLAARLVELALLLVDLPHLKGGGNDVTNGDASGAASGDANGDANGAASGAANRWVHAWTLGPGSGLAAVQTARGLLLHHARLAHGLVADYRIVAPTEWNFHPQGALFRGIVGTEAGDEATLVARTGLAVQALDPCVGFRIEVVRDA